MIQPMKKRRSGWAVLVVSALIASILAAGAVPAGAVTDRSDHTTPLSACVGDAAVDQLFRDVSQGHVFRDAINCIAYYEITQGTDDGSTYSPEQDVTPRPDGRVHRPRRQGCRRRPRPRRRRPLQ